MSENPKQYGYCPTCKSMITSDHVFNWEGIELVFTCPLCSKRLYVEQLKLK